MGFIEEIGFFDLLHPGNREEILKTELRIKENIISEYEPWTNVSHIPQGIPTDKHKCISLLISCIVLHVMTLLVSNCVLGKASDTKSTDYKFEKFEEKYFKLSYFLVPIYIIFTGVSIKYLIKERQDEDVSE